MRSPSSTPFKPTRAYSDSTFSAKPVVIFCKAIVVFKPDASCDKIADAALILRETVVAPSTVETATAFSPLIVLALIASIADERSLSAAL
jgi:hypothetical protein